jgi:hypothetical protein
VGGGLNKSVSGRVEGNIGGQLAKQGTFRLRNGMGVSMKGMGVSMKGMGASIKGMGSTATPGDDGQDQEVGNVAVKFEKLLRIML